MKAAIIAARGCEEGEALTIADILRRAELTCDMIGLDQKEITGAHGITILCDSVLSEEVSEYDMIILPGGYEGRDAMKKSEKLIEVLKKMHTEGKKIAAICAAPEVLDQAGILEGKKYTCYPTVKENIRSGIYTGGKTVADGNVITGEGPAMAWAFAYRLADVLGADSLSVKKRMVYFNAFDVKEDE